MIYNTTYHNEDYLQQSKEVVGKAFSFLERLKMGGIGSGRLMIAEISPKLKLGKLEFSEIDYGNIELRPQGIIVHYTSKLERFSWVIPFFRLNTYNAQTYSIHADGSYIKFEKNKNYKENKKFLEKMADRKIEVLGLGYYDE